MEPTQNSILKQDDLIKTNQRLNAQIKELSKFVIDCILKALIPLTVTFKIDKSRYAGHSHSIPRYYALNVETKNILFL